VVGQDYTRYLLFVVIYILLLTIIYMFFFKTELRRKNAGKILIKSQPDGAFPEGRGLLCYIKRTSKGGMKFILTSIFEERVCGEWTHMCRFYFYELIWYVYLYF
jgi:hypothetical protein